MSCSRLQTKYLDTNQNEDIVSIFDFWTDTIGVDPGTDRLRIVKEGNVIFDEKSQISWNKTTESVSGFGDSVGTTSDHVIIKPVNYSIWDFHAFEMLLRSATKKSLKDQWVFPKSYRMFFVVPTGINEVEKRAYRDSGEHANAKEVYMVSDSFCSAISLNILQNKKDFILIDFGASKVEMTIFADSVPVCIATFRLGMMKIVSLLTNYFYRTYSVRLSEKEIENIFHSLDEDQFNAINLDGLVIESKEIHQALNSFFNLVNDDLLEKLDLIRDHARFKSILSNGIYFTGGGSAIPFVRNQIKFREEIKCQVSSTPLLDRVNGLKIIMANVAQYGKCLMT